MNFTMENPNNNSENSHHGNLKIVMDSFCCIFRPDYIVLRHKQQFFEELYLHIYIDC